MMQLAKRPLIIALALLVGLSAASAAYLSILDNMDRARRLHQVKDILSAARIHATRHGGALPKTFSDLATLTDSTGALYYRQADGAQPFLERASRELEIVAPGILDQADPATPYVWERHPDRKGRWVVGYVDTSAQMTGKLPPLPKPAPHAYVIPAASLPAGDFMTPLEKNRLTPH